MKSLTSFQPGNFPVRSRSDIPEALEALKNRPLYAEKWAHFKMVNLFWEGGFLFALALALGFEPPLYSPLST